MPGAVKRGSEGQTARGRNIKFAICGYSPGEKVSGGTALKERDSPLPYRCKEKQNKQGQDGRVSPA